MNDKKRFNNSKRITDTRKGSMRGATANDIEELLCDVCH